MSRTIVDALTRTFASPRDFGAVREAERFLADRGFSYGRLERGAPRGILLGDFDIQKWRNLSAKDRFALHGEMTGDFRRGPVRVVIYAGNDAAAAAFSAVPE